MLTINSDASLPKHQLLNDVLKYALERGLTIDDIDYHKPWGFYIRFLPGDAEKFLPEFFPGLTLEEAQLGNPNAALSPKFLVVLPGELLSWQYHDRRAERWTFITPGGYYKSETDEQGDLHAAVAGEVVQFAATERHRLAAADDAYTVVAEIWQHTDKNHLSDESDIVRLADKYQR